MKLEIKKRFKLRKWFRLSLMAVVSLIAGLILIFLTLKELLY